MIGTNLGATFLSLKILLNIATSAMVVDNSLSPESFMEASNILGSVILT